MQRPERVMVWLTENIQACLWIFWQLQHQWLVRDILHRAQGVFMVLSYIHHRSTLMRTYPAAYCPPGRGLVSVYIRGRCPRLLMVVPSRHQSAYGVLSVVEKEIHRTERFILVYRLAMDARTLEGDGVAD